MNPSKRILLPDYLAAHPNEFVKINAEGNGYTSGAGGGGATPTLNLVLAEGGSLTEDRTVDLGGNQLDFLSGGNTLLQITPGSFNNRFIATDGTGSGKLDLKGNSAGEVSFELAANNGVNEVQILGNAGDNTLEYNAATHIIGGDVILDDLSGGGVTGASIDNDGKLIRTP